MITGIPLALGFLQNSQVHLDQRYTNNNIPYASIAEVLSILPMNRRVLHLPVDIQGVEYWFDTPELDHLSPKTATFTVQEPLGKSGNDIILQYDSTTLALLSGNLKVRDNIFPLLDGGGKIPSSYLPGTVSDIIERTNYSTMILTVGLVNTLYITIDNNKIYRWSGTQYTELPASLALGVTHDSAGYGDWTKLAYDVRHSHSNKAALDLVQGVNMGDETKFTIENKLTGEIISHTHKVQLPIFWDPNGIGVAYDPTQFQIVNNKLTLISSLANPKYINSTAIPEQVHGFDAGTSFPSPGKTYQEMFDILLYPYQIPTLSSLAVNGFSQVTPIEVGVDLSGSKTFVWNNNHPENIVINSGILYDGATVIQDTINIVPNSLTLNLNISNLVPFTKSYKLTASPTKGSDIVSNIFTINSVWPMYIGSVASLNPSAITIQAMTKRVLPKGPQSMIYTITDRRFCFASATSSGDITSIKDTNGFEILSGFTITTVLLTINLVTQNYNIYTLTLPTTQTNFTVTYSF